MTGTVKRRVALQTIRIDLNDPWDIFYWCVTLGVTEDVLRMAVDAVGVKAVDVKPYLGAQKAGGKDAKPLAGESVGGRMPPYVNAHRVVFFFGEGF
jgi:Protein of unknown function (DUF3606)